MYEGIVEGIVNRLSVINYLHYIVFQRTAEYKIGVLAKRGVEHAMKQWRLTANIQKETGNKSYHYPLKIC